MTASADPIIRISCTEELLQQLHAAREAVLRARTKTRPSIGRLDELILAVSRARSRVPAQPLTLENSPHAGQ